MLDAIDRELDSRGKELERVFVGRQLFGRQILKFWDAKRWITARHFIRAMRTVWKLGVLAPAALAL